jgi:cellulose synthase/poly-beta-1,6-N-acetylglucosamine synthase-like glycosyltransferase
MIDLLKTVYLVCAVLLGLYAASQLILILLYLRYRRQVAPLPAVDELPEVVVQLPLYNEPFVVRRLLAAAANLDYPRDRLVIQVLDDSNDETSKMVAAEVQRLRKTGLNIQHVQRKIRVGYKAGALAYGLDECSAEFVAIFDADFEPPPDFLLRTIPYFLNNPRLGIVQTRWGHLNASANWLTRAQSLAIDAHFMIEQPARNRANLLLTFNGTGGVWRRECIEDAGGWSAETLTEDLDLSYRAQLKGWQYQYLPDIVVPGEIPPVMSAYKQQQARWAQGTNQALCKLLLPVWRSNLRPAAKVMATHHLIQYLPHTIMVFMFLLSPLLILSGAMDDISLTWLGVIGFIPPMMHILAQYELGSNLPRRLMYFPILMVIGTGLMLNNAVAAFKAFYGRLTYRSGEFVRTPKFGNGKTKTYTMPRGWLFYVELACAVYAIFGCIVALQVLPGMFFYMLLYAVAFSAMVGWNFYDQWQLNRLPLMSDLELEAEEDLVASEAVDPEAVTEVRYETVYS